MLLTWHILPTVTSTGTNTNPTSIQSEGNQEELKQDLEQHKEMEQDLEQHKEMEQDLQHHMKMEQDLQHQQNFQDNDLQQEEQDIQQEQVSPREV